MARRTRTAPKESRSLLRLIPRHGAYLAALIVGLAAFAVALVAQAAPLLAVVAGADAMFVVYLVLVAIDVPRLTPDYLRRHADEANVPIGVIFAATLIVVGVCAYSLFETLNSADAAPVLVVVASVASVLLGWFVIHAMAAMHYAYEYYESGSANPGSARSKGTGGFSWPENSEEPNGVAFLYIAYQIGSAMQIADVETTSNKVRGIVGAHIVLAFLYNTLLVAATVNVVVSVGGG